MVSHDGSSVVLGSSPSFRVLILTDAPAQTFNTAQNIHATLIAAGHPVGVMSVENLLSGGEGENPLADSAAAVLLLDTGTNLESVSEVCRRIKSESGVESLPIIAVLAPAEKTGRFDGQVWATLRRAGVDDFLSANADEMELEARLGLLSRFARLNRELNNAREQLSRSLQFDDLTQLMNRRFFFKAAHREWARARRYQHSLACLMIDINYFRLYNSTFGFACGDYVLRSVANIIRQWTRESDIVARFAEEKFVIMLPETDVQGVVMLRENLLKVVAETEFTWQQQKLPVSISIGESDRRGGGTGGGSAGDTVGNGGSEAQNDEDEVESLSVREEVAELLADADAALNVAKKGARYPAFCVDATTGLLAISTEGTDEASVMGGNR